MREPNLKSHSAHAMSRALVPLLPTARGALPTSSCVVLQSILEAAGVKPPGTGKDEWNGYQGDPFEFLPKWMTANPLRAK